MSSTFGSRLRALRLAAGLSAQDLADKAGTSRTYIHDLERDARSPAWDLVVKLADALGCTPNDFQDDRGNGVIPLS